jgi:hypothetical protein
MKAKDLNLQFWTETHKIDSSDEQYKILKKKLSFNMSVSSIPQNLMSRFSGIYLYMLDKYFMILIQVITQDGIKIQKPGTFAI